MHSAPEVIAGYLRSLLIATDPREQKPWPIFIGQLDTAPDTAIGIFDLPGTKTGRIHRTGKTMGLGGYQVRVRCKAVEDGGYTDAREKSYEISDLFDKTGAPFDEDGNALPPVEVTVEEKVYHVQAIHQETVRPIFIGPDPNNRMNFALNGTISFWEKLEIFGK